MLASIAFFHRMNAESNMPNWHQFSQELGTGNEAETVENYLSYLSNQIAMTASSRRTGLEFDTDSFVPGAAGAVHSN